MWVKSLPITVMKGYPYVGASLYSLHVPSGLGGRAEFDVNKSQIFPWGLLAPTTLVGDGAGDRRPRARARCKVGLLLCSVATTTISGTGASPKLLEEKPLWASLSWLCFL